MRFKHYFFFVLIFSYSFSYAKKIVLTGGPGVGKTTVITLLQQLGYAIIPDVYTLLYEEHKRRYPILPFDNYSDIFRSRVIKKQQTLENLFCNSTLVFLDRSILDVCFFGLYYKTLQPEELSFDMMQYDYDYILFLEPLTKELYEQHDRRQETYEESCKIHEFLKLKYTQCGYSIHLIPFDAPLNRVRYILEHFH